MESVDTKKGFYGLADFPTIFQEKTDRTLGYAAAAWLDDFLVITRRDRTEQAKELFDVIKKLKNAGYRASEKNPNSSQRRSNDWYTKSTEQGSNRLKKN